MQKVISNSSTIIHLAKINELTLLKEYYQTITIPAKVQKECIFEGEDRKEVEIIKGADWINVEHVKDQNLVKLLRTTLDDGESEAIALAVETGADLILLDDSDAREKARLFGLNITGIIGILLRAKSDGKIVSLKEKLTALKESGFWIGVELEKVLLSEAAES
jgi:predicted nucleic acid-binding protein